VAAGDDSRFTDARTPTGTAGGALAGTYPNPTLAVAYLPLSGGTLVGGLVVAPTTNPVRGIDVLYTAAAAGAVVTGIRSAPTLTGTSAQPTGIYLVPTSAPPAATTVGSFAGVRINMTTGATGAGAITALYSVVAMAPTYTLKPADSRGLRVENHGSASITTTHGISVAVQSGSTTNYGIFFDAGTTDAAGINWGGDTNLYRSAAGTLKTDGAFKTGAAATGSRPSATTVGVGARFYDTTLSKPIWSDGTTWRDAAGTAA
jgi:hypothetical protein